MDCTAGLDVFALLVGSSDGSVVLYAMVSVLPDCAYATRPSRRATSDVTDNTPAPDACRKRRLVILSFNLFSSIFQPNTEARRSRGHGGIRRYTSPLFQIVAGEHDIRYQIIAYKLDFFLRVLRFSPCLRVGCRR